MRIHFKLSGIRTLVFDNGTTEKKIQTKETDYSFSTAHGPNQDVIDEVNIDMDKKTYDEMRKMLGNNGFVVANDVKVYDSYLDPKKVISTVYLKLRPTSYSGGIANFTIL